MLTPAFELKQDAKNVVFIIKAPYTKVSETEIFAEGNEFRFYSKPYFLRLNLSGNILESDSSSAKYDADAGTFTIKLCKENPGEHFQDLDMLTKLLAPTTKTSDQQPSIEIIGEENQDKTEDDLEEEELEFDWQIEQQPFQEESISLGSVNYGFANQKSGVFKRLQCELKDVIDLPNADGTLPSDRSKLREKEESDTFDEDYYLAELYSDEMVQEALQYQAQWQREYQQWKQDDNREDIVRITDDEKAQLRQLPRRSYLIDEKTLHGVYLGLIDIIYAYAYDQRVTEGESNVESNWTISKISSTLSWLEEHGTLHDTVKTCMRRSLCYPLHRHWQLAKQTLTDTQQIFSLGKKRLLKCLLDMHVIFAHSDPKHVLNDLFITDYCVWIQSASSKQIQSLADALQQIELSKAEMELGLIELESAAAMAMKEEEEENTTELSNELAAMSVTCSHHGNPSTTHSNSTKTKMAAENCETCLRRSSDESSSEIDSDDDSDEDDDDDSTSEDSGSDDDSEDDNNEDEEDEDGKGEQKQIDTVDKQQEIAETSICTADCKNSNVCDDSSSSGSHKLDTAAT